jgi:hypothetical protein
MTRRATPTLMRETLESIRDRFVADEDRFVLFTTFNFVPSFFETNVLPLLAGERAGDLQNAPQVRYGLNDELRNLRCVVVCDQSTQPPAKGDVRYGLLTVGLPQGRFHPKLMLMAGTLRETGKPGLWLAVGSGNLSLSGWAINREVIGAAAVTPQHADELLPLLQWMLAQAERQLGGRDMKEEGSARAVLRELVARLGDRQGLQSEAFGAPTLHVTMPWHQSRSMARMLTGERRWKRATVVSPFWGQVDDLVRELGVRECRFVPSLAGGGYRFPLASLGKQHGWERSFASFGDDRYTHAKVLLLEDEQGRAVLCTGSANFTGAALGQPVSDAFANVEAMLRYELTAVPRPWLKLQTLDESRLEEQPEGEDEQAPPLPPFEVCLVHDWQRRVFEGVLSVRPDAAVRDLELHVAGSRLRPAGRPGAPIPLSLACTCREPVRTFRVNWTDTEGRRVSFLGLVTQVNADDDQLQYQPRPRLDDVLGFLQGLNPAVDEDEIRRRSAMDGDGVADGDEEEREPSFDYFGLFQATWKLREYYRRQDAARLQEIAFDGLSRHSVTTLVRAILLQPDLTNEQRIARFVQLCEARDLVDWLRTRDVEPEGGNLVDELEGEIGALTPTVATLLQDSRTFGDMPSGLSAQARVDAFLGWFHREYRNRGAVHGR